MTMNDYSQNGEQAFIAKYFESLTCGTYVDVGAFDGVTGSNTMYLQAIGWYGVCIEPCHDSYQLLVKNRKSDRTQCFELACVGDDTKSVEFYTFEGIPQFNSIAPNGAKILREIKHCGIDLKYVVGRVESTTLDNLLSNLIKRVDFVSIDVEGFEMHVLKGFDLHRWQPSLLCIEHNDSRLFELSGYMLEHGYRVAHKNEVNCFFVPVGREL